MYTADVVAFKVFALDQPLNLLPGASKEQVMAAMEGHVLDAAEVMGRYARELPD